MTMHSFIGPAAAACLLVLSGFVGARGADVPPRAGDSYPSQNTVHEVGGKTLSEWMADLKHRDPSIRARAISNIVFFGEGASVAVPLLVERTQDRDTSPRTKAVMALRFVSIKKEHMPKVIDALAHRLTDDPQTIVRYEAALGLAHHSDEAKPAVWALIRGVEDPATFEIRYSCIIALRKAAFDPKSGPDPRATHALLRALGDVTERVRLEATVTLGAMGKPNDLNLLAAVTAALQKQVSVKDKALSLWSHVALYALDDKVSDKYLQEIIKLLKSPEREIKLQVLYALAAMGHRARVAVPDVLEALEDKEVPVVAAACAALAHLGDQSSRILAALIKASERKEQQIVLAACDALGQIGRRDADVMNALTKVTQRKELDDQLLAVAGQILDKLRKPPK
jgi:HEAT repeat protein